jgi:Ni,Fe-hydrogenase III large subunit
MSEQPTALRLADELADYTGFTVVGMDQAAAELRRQHQEIEQLRVREAADLLEIGRLVVQRDELLETLKLVFPALERLKFEADGSYGSNFSQARADTARKNYQAARGAIAKAEGQA